MSKLPAPYRALQEEMAARHRRDECTIAQLRARNEELERQLADAEYEIKALGEKLSDAWQRIAESQTQKPIYQQWIECGGWEDTEKEAYDTVPDYDRRIIYTAPVVPPDVEEAVKAEREACAKICDELGSTGNDARGEWPDGYDTGCEECADAIRARSEK